MRNVKPGGETRHGSSAESTCHASQMVLDTASLQKPPIVIFPTSILQSMYGMSNITAGIQSCHGSCLERLNNDSLTNLVNLAQQANCAKLMAAWDA